MKSRHQRSRTATRLALVTSAFTFAAIITVTFSVHLADAGDSSVSARAAADTVNPTCAALRAQFGPGWPCISVPNNTPTTTIPTAPTAPAGPTTGGGVNMHVDAGPGPGTGNGTPIVPVPGQPSQPPMDTGVATPVPSVTAPIPPRPLSQFLHEAGGYPSDETLGSATTRTRAEVLLRRGFYDSASDTGFGFDKAYWKHNLRNKQVILDVLSAPDSSISANSDGDGLQYEHVVKHYVCEDESWADVFLGGGSKCEVTGQVNVVVATSDADEDTYYGMPVHGELGVKTAYCEGMARCPDWVSDDYVHGK